jgi:DNA-binding MarR family transcriptional regulator
VASADSQDISLAVRRLLQAAREMQSAAARRLGLRITDVQAMDLVTASEGRISPAELADRLGIRSASASALIDRMVAAGHMERLRVDRTDGLGDRRRTQVHATPHARAEVRNTLRDINEGFDELARSLSPEEAATVMSFLQRATGIMRDYAAGEDSDGEP